MVVADVSTVGLRMPGHAVAHVRESRTRRCYFGPERLPCLSDWSGEVVTPRRARTRRYRCNTPAGYRDTSPAGTVEFDATLCRADSEG